MTLTQYVDQRGQAIRLGRELGRGGQGAVYEVAGQQGAVAKIYLTRPDSATSNKLTALAQLSAPELLAVSAWPQSILRDSSGQVHGFVMPLVAESEYHELHNLYRNSSRRQLFPQADWRFLVHVARNLSRAFIVLHARNHLMGDVSSRNVMVSKNGTVRLIDTDSFQITVQNQSYPCPVGTPEFTPPELQGQSFGTLIRNQQHDLFGLAQLIFHLLFDGRHPYAGVHDNGASPSPAEAISADKFAYSLQYRHGVRPPPFVLTLQGLHPQVRDLFERAFSPQHQGRPSAAEWEGAMGELAEQLITCTNNSAHKHDKRLACPRCGLLSANVQAATVKTGIPLDAKRIEVERELNRIWISVQAIRPPGLPMQLPVALPDPLTVTAQFAITKPKNGISIAAYIWSTFYLILGIASLLNSIWFGLLIFSMLSYYNFSRNSIVNVRARREKQFNPTRTEHEREADNLRQQLSQFHARQQVASAHQQYLIAMSSLDGMQKNIRGIDQTEQAKLKEVVERYRRPLIEQHLAKSIIRPGEIPGVGPALIADLNRRGVYTAKDITVQVGLIKGVGPKRQRDLLAWRETLEQFFQFSSSQVPPLELEMVRGRLNQDRKLKLAQFEQAAEKLKNDLPDWENADAVLAIDILNLKTRILEREKAVELIERIMAQH